MRRPWRRVDHDSQERADRALQETARRRVETEDRDQAFLRLADRVRQMREANHLAEAVEAALSKGDR